MKFSLTWEKVLLSSHKYVIRIYMWVHIHTQNTKQLFYVSSSPLPAGNKRVMQRITLFLFLINEQDIEKAFLKKNFSVSKQKKTNKLFSKREWLKWLFGMILRRNPAWGLLYQFKVILLKGKKSKVIYVQLVVCWQWQA